MERTSAYADFVLFVFLFIAIYLHPHIFERPEEDTSSLVTRVTGCVSFLTWVLAILVPAGSSLNHWVSISPAPALAFLNSKLFFLVLVTFLL